MEGISRGLLKARRYNVYRLRKTTNTSVILSLGLSIEPWISQLPSLNFRSICIGTGSSVKIRAMHTNSSSDSQCVIKHPSQHPCTYQVLLQLVQSSDESGSGTWLNRRQHFYTIISVSQLHLRAPNEPAGVHLSAWLLDWCSPDPATSNSFKYICSQSPLFWHRSASTPSLSKRL